MPANPYQIKDISFEKLDTLRIKVRETYKKRTGEDLPDSKTKDNPYFIELIDDISKKTETKEISQGTIQKFFNNNVNRNYRIFIIQTLEKYISATENDNTQKNEIDIITTKNSVVKVNAELKLFAQRIYIELTTRKAAIPIDEENDVIEDIYNSWYKLFCIIRDEMKTLPVGIFTDEDSQPLIILATKILNAVLRPHLTEHQASYRNWLDRAKTNPKNKSLSPQELQRKYPDYDALMKSMMQVNRSFIEISENMKRN